MEEIQARVSFTVTNGVRSTRIFTAGSSLNSILISQQITMIMDKTIFLKIIGFFLLGWSSLLHSAERHAGPMTEWGHPDLQVVWNFSSRVPMQRPPEFSRRQFLTEEEVSKGIRHFELGAGADVVPPNRFGIGSFYNDIRVDNSGRYGRVRTSYIIYPLNGQIPGVDGVDRIPGV